LYFLGIDLSGFSFPFFSQDLSAPNVSLFRPAAMLATQLEFRQFPRPFVLHEFPNLVRFLLAFNFSHKKITLISYLFLPSTLGSFFDALENQAASWIQLMINGVAKKSPLL